MLGFASVEMGGRCATPNHVMMGCGHKQRASPKLHTLRLRMLLTICLSAQDWSATDRSSRI